MGDIAPKLAELTDNVLFGDIWARPGLSKRDRSLVTVSALIAMNRPDQLRSHMARARQNGVTEEELVEAITQLAFYAGWPNAITAIGVAREFSRSEISATAATCSDDHTPTHPRRQRRLRRARGGNQTSRHAGTQKKEGHEDHTQQFAAVTKRSGREFHRVCARRHAVSRHRAGRVGGGIVTFEPARAPPGTRIRSARP